MENFKFIILISHEYYGGCYVTNSNQLTKDRNEAKIFIGTWEYAKEVEKKLKSEFKYEALYQHIK